MRFLVALFLAALLACTSTADVRLHPAETPVAHAAPARDVLVDDAFDAPDQDAILGAVDTWNVTFAGALRLHARPSPITPGDMASDAILIMRVDSTCTFIPTTLRPGAVLAFTERVGGRLVWVVRDRLGSWQVQPVVLHELGHVFGALDREGPGLMHWAVRPLEYRCVDKVTAGEVASWLGVPAGALAYCETPRAHEKDDIFTEYPPLQL